MNAATFQSLYVLFLNQAVLITATMTSPKDTVED